MPKRFTIDLECVDAAIAEPATKFGGQPVWIDAPTWPVSRALQIPMTFVCQVALSLEVGGTQLSGKMAYFFVTDGSDARGSYVSGGCLNDGESAVVVQPGQPTPCMPVIPAVSGPSIHYFDELGPRDRRGKLTRRIYPEYRVIQTPGEDPEYVPLATLWGWDKPDPTQGGWPEADRDAYLAAIKGNKIGGTPGFFQTDDYPPGGDWLLLLQFDQLPDPCINLGDAGSGYVFLSGDGQRSQYIVQSC